MKHSDTSSRIHRSLAFAWSPGVLVVVALALLSTVALLADRRPPRRGLQLWTFAREHQRIYEPALAQWREQGGPLVDVSVFDVAVLDRRVLGGFLSRTPTAPLIEMVYGSVGRTFRGPIEGVGFLDLTERLRETGMLDRINPPSLTPWTHQGHMFGIPHDVHPVMLVYHADLVEAAAIDVNDIETWDDFTRILAPLMADNDHDGRPDHYLLGFWETHVDNIELLIRQAGGHLFAPEGKPDFATDTVAHVLSTMVSWTTGPNRIATDIPDFIESGDIRKGRADAIAFFCPDWMCRLWERDIPQAAGHVALMTLPAWEPGARRTSVRGGTMLGIARNTPDLETAWKVASRLYFSREVAEETFRVGGIITPVRDLWSLPVFDEPNPYFRNQPVGRLFINLAEDVPTRTSSPYGRFALLRVQDVLCRLKAEAKERGIFDPPSLEPIAHRLLLEAQNDLARRIDRNRFLAEETAP